MNLKGKLILIGAEILLCGSMIAGFTLRDQTSTFTLKFEHTFGNRPFVFQDLSLKNTAGNTMSVTRVSYLISDVSLVRPDGTEQKLPSQIGWISLAEERTEFELKDVPVGDYNGLKFQVGLDPKTNHSNPTQYAPEHPLNPVLNQLHWSWQGTYVFFAIEGRYEETANRLGGYSYHIGNDENLMQVSLRKTFKVKPDRVQEVNLDIAKVIGTTKLGSASDSSHSAPGDKLAAQLKKNLETAFSLGREFARSTPPIPVVVVKKAPKGTTPYVLKTPDYFPQAELPPDNPLTVEGIALGKKLFNETRLSGNNTQSCASCHQTDVAFSDKDKALSIGIDKQKGLRNSMALFNLAWSPQYTWDGRRVKLRDQVLAPIQDKVEMHQTLTRSIQKIKAIPAYAPLFAKAFGSPGITSERLSLAVEQYLLTLVSADSRFDKALRKEVEFTDQEKRGLQIFLTEHNPAQEMFGADCFHCHGGNLFTDFRYKNNGIAPRKTDAGRERVTGEYYDANKFKTPSLRNVALTAPYMHDGRFKTLEEVVEHYNSGVHRSDTLDPNIAKHPDAGLKLSTADKKALVAFLRTLTDEKFARQK